MTWAVVWFARPASRTASSKQPHAYVGPVAAVSSRSVATSHAATCPTPPKSHTHRECRFHPPTHPNSRRPNAGTRPANRAPLLARAGARKRMRALGTRHARANMRVRKHARARALRACDGSVSGSSGRSWRREPTASGSNATRAPCTTSSNRAGGWERAPPARLHRWRAGTALIHRICRLGSRQKGNLPHPKRSCSA